MSKRELFTNLGINLDIALEAHEIIRGETGAEIPGVRKDEEKFENATVTTVTVVTPEAEQIMGKPIGSYITIEAPGIRRNNRDIQREISQILAKKLVDVLNLKEHTTILLVGLGNWNATPDALGPTVIDHTMVTRHIHKYAPEELRGGLRSVCALAPGVLGITGIETAEIIRGVVDRVKPDLVIAIDALAATNVERICSTIQISTTGINPGSGVGNRRTGINIETMGVPVYAIGVPTVVHAGVIANAVVEGLVNELQTSPTLYQIYKGLNPQAVQGIITNVMAPFAGNLMVTPKEIDELIENTSEIIAAGLSQALHPGIGPEECMLYLQ
ncbi:MAG: GPR endopeptidase [Thermincolia bacterium]